MELVPTCPALPEASINKRNQWRFFSETMTGFTHNSPQTVAVGVFIGEIFSQKYKRNFQLWLTAKAEFGQLAGSDHFAKFHCFAPLQDSAENINVCIVCLVSSNFSHGES